MSLHRSRYARFRPKKTPRRRLLRFEHLEPRAVLASTSLLGNLQAIAINRTVAAANAAPVVVRPISVVTGSASNVIGKSVILSVLGNDDQGEANLIYNWSLAGAPAGGSASFSTNGTNGAKIDTVTFTKAGAYSILVRIVDKAGLAATSSISVTVQQRLTAIGIYNPDTQAVVMPGAAVRVTGASQKLGALAVDQFGYALAVQPVFTWASIAYPSGAKPTISGSAAAVVAFTSAGTYGASVSATGSGGAKAAATVAMNVVQTLTSIVVTPGTASMAADAAKQFSAQGLDQFRKAMSTQPAFTWSATGGSISAAGLFTAPATAGVYDVTAVSGAIRGTAKATVTAAAPSPTPSPAPTPAPGGIQNVALANLVRSLFVDASLSRNDMIQILTSVGTDGTVDATEFADLKTILTNATQYNMPGYVQVLAGDVVNGNVANAKYQGATLGNLAAGSSSTQLNKLIDKWFRGTDRPALTSSSLTYKAAAGPLFAQTPTHYDERQGQLGDCYLISALGTIADNNPSAVQNMFIDNGDGTYTVRFYGGTYGAYYAADGTISDGFRNNACTADYVTVDRMLVTYSNGAMAYSNFGVSVTSTAASIWLPLAEKAYAQWNETGKAGRDGRNAYASIEGGWMATVDAQVLGRNATDYYVNASTKQAMINALASRKAVTIGTISGGLLPYNLYGSHAYGVTAYNAGADLFTLYNPWGTDQPGVLSWAQIQATCSAFVVADPSGSTPIAGGNLRSAPRAAVEVAALSSILDTVSATADSTPTALASWSAAPVGGATSSGLAAEEAPAGEDRFATLLVNGENTDQTPEAESGGALSPAGVDTVLASHEFGKFFVA